MNAQSSKDPFHGVTLAMILEVLVKHYGWGELGKRINIRCFNMNPSIKSSLTFLRKTPWAREKVETLYLCLVTAKDNQSRPAQPPAPRRPASPRVPCSGPERRPERRPERDGFRREF